MRVKQIIEMKPEYGSGIQAGVVAILEDHRPTDLAEAVGRWAMIQASPTSLVYWKISDVRDHGRTISLFFADMDAGKISVGARIVFPVSIEGVDRAFDIILPPGRALWVTDRSA